MYCLRVFIVVLQDKNYIVYYNDYCNYFGVFIEKHVYTKFDLIGGCVSELHVHVCPYQNYNVLISSESITL